jgi:hypothetical protein
MFENELYGYMPTPATTMGGMAGHEEQRQEVYEEVEDHDGLYGRSLPISLMMYSAGMSQSEQQVDRSLCLSGSVRSSEASFVGRLFSKSKKSMFSSFIVPDIDVSG